MTAVSRPQPSTPACYTPVVYPSIRDVDWDEWNRLRDPQSDPFMDPRFILAIENSMGSVCRFRHVFIRDAAGRTVAAACLSVYTVDGALLAEGSMRIIAAVLNRIVPPLLKIPVVLCGLPVSVAASSLRFSPDADRPAVLTILDELAQNLAQESRAKCIVFKEFDQHECQDLDFLDRLGYRRGDTPPMNCVPAEYRSLEEYVARTNSARRRTIRRSREKFAKGNLKIVHLLGVDGAADLYTDEVHRLYTAVLNHATVRFEVLPAEFFRELARQLPQNSLFTFFSHQDRIVAFAATIFCENLFDQIYVGFDYHLNHQFDLYFNLFFEAVEEAFRRAPQRIFVGQTSDDFKHQKLSTFQFPLCLYAKGNSRIARVVLSRLFELFFPPRPMKHPGKLPELK